MKRKFKSLDDEKEIDIQNYLLGEWDEEDIHYENEQGDPEGYMLKAAIEAVSKMTPSQQPKGDEQDGSAPKLLPAEAFGTKVTKVTFHPEQNAHEEEEGDTEDGTFDEGNGSGKNDQNEGEDKDDDSASQPSDDGNEDSDRPEQEEEKLRISPVPMPEELKTKNKMESVKKEQVKATKPKKKSHDVRKRYERFLTNVQDSHAFRLKDGKALMNMRDLSSALLTMPTEVYDHHVTQERNDFYNWVSAVVGDKAAANSIQKSKTRYEMAQRISARIQFLERKCR